MELNSIINDDELSMKMQDIYKFIDRNHDKFDTIFERVFDDIKKQYSDAVLVDNTIELNNIDVKAIVDITNNCQNILSYHAKSILEDKKYLISYVFKINTINNSVNIIKKK